MREPHQGTEAVESREACGEAAAQSGEGPCENALEKYRCSCAFGNLGYNACNSDAGAEICRKGRQGYNEQDNMLLPP